MRGITPEESIVLIGGGFAHTGLESLWEVVAEGADPVGGRAGGVTVTGEGVGLTIVEIFPVVEGVTTFTSKLVVTEGVVVGGTFLRIPISAEPVFVEPVLDTGIFISVEVLLLGSHP